MDALSKLVPADSQLADRLTYYPTADPAVFAAVGRGLVFMMAWWSGSARLAWRDVREAVAAADPAGRLRVAVLDIDGLTGFDGHAPGLPVCGAGETAWAWDGRPVGDRWLLPLAEPDLLRANTELLVSWCEGQP